MDPMPTSPHAAHDHPGTVPSVRRRRRFGRRTTTVLALLGAVLAVGLAAVAQQPVVLDVTVSAAASGPDDVDLTSLTYEQAKTALTTPGRTRATLPVAPAGTPEVSAPGANVHFMDDAAPSLAVLGTADVAGQATEVLVTAVWANAGDASPDVAVLLGYDAIGLGDLVQFDAFPLGLQRTVLGTARTPHTVDPETLPPGIAAFFNDGTGLDTAIDVDPALALRGVIDAGATPLGDAARQIGLSGQVRLDGHLSATPASLGNGDPAGLDLTATLPVATGGSLPDFVRLADPWALHLATRGGAVGVDFSGSAAFDITGTTFTNVTVDVGIAHQAGATNLSLAGTMGRLDDVAGQPWLDLDQVRLDAAVSSTDGFSGGVTARVDLQDLIGQPAVADVALELRAGSGGAAGRLDLTTDASTSVAQLATALGSNLPHTDADLSLNGFGLSVGFDSTAGFTAAVTSNVTATVGGATFASDVLLRVEAGAGQPHLLLALRPDATAPTVTLSQLLGSPLPSDVILPEFTLTLATGDVFIPAVELDAATARYLGDGEALDVASGVVIGAAAELPPELQTAVNQVGLSTDGPLMLEGRIPVFGAVETSVAVTFPTIVGGPDQPFQSGNMELQIKASPSGFEFRIAGEASVAVPRTEDADCAEPWAGACSDVLDFTLEAILGVSADGGISFELLGDLTADANGADPGWQEPFGVNGLTVHQLALKVGVEVSQGTGKVTIGMLGRIQINDIDLTASFKLGVTPNPPWIEPLGFTFASERGFGFHDITTLVELVTQTDLPPALDIPPTLRLEDVFVSFGKVNDSDLCLRQGFFLTGELHLGGEPRTSGATPGCEPPPVSPPEVTAECASSPSCLATMLIEVDDGQASGNPGIRGAGFIRQADFGPFHIDPTILQLELSAQEQRLFFSAGGRIDDIANPSVTWADARILMDLTPTKMVVNAHAKVRDGRHLGMRLRGAAALDLANPEFILDVDLNTNVLAAVANEISPELADFIADIQDFANLYDIPEVNIFRNLYNLLQARGNTPQWALELIGVLGEVEQVVLDINEFLRGIGFPGIPLIEIRNLVLKGVEFPLPGTPAWDTHTDAIIGNEHHGVDGCINVQGRHADGKCYGIPPVTITLPGVCDIPGFDQLASGDVYAVLCISNDLDDDLLVEEVFEDEAIHARGVTLPGSVTSRQVLREVAPQLDGTHTAATCGRARMDYSTGTVTEPELTLNVGEVPMVVGMSLDIFRAGGSEIVPAGQAIEEVVNELTGHGDVTAGNCGVDSSTAFVFEDEVTVWMRFFHAHSNNYSATVVEVDSGEPVTPLVSCGDVSQPVRINWGDGSPTEHVDLGGGNDANTLLLPEFTELATHVYSHSGRGSTSTYNPTVNCAGAVDTVQVIVRNVAPVITGVAFDADRVEEGTDATLAVSFTDGVGDSHRIHVTWADGTTQTVDVPAPDGSAGEERHVTIARPILDDDPTGQPTGTETASVVVVDSSSEASDTVAATIGVDNVDPTVVSIVPIASDTGDTDADGNPIAVENTGALWELTVADQGVFDPITAEVTWPDGTVHTVEIPATGAQERRVVLAHQLADDDPTDTPVDDMPVVVTVTDDDTGTTTAEVGATVHNTAPEVVSLTVLPETHEENGTDVTLDLAFTDRALADSHRVTIDCGDGWTDDIPVGADASGTDARTSVIDLDAVAPDGSPVRTLTATNRYGDDGVHQVTVTITDDDTGQVTASRLVEVANVAPDAGINDSADQAVSTPGGATHFAGAGQAVTTSSTATDPGSDDLTFTWDHGDGATTTNQSLAGPDPDADPSPHVGPRTVTDTADHAYAEACLYGIGSTVADDDGGTSDADHVAAVITRARDAGDDTRHNHGGWKEWIRNGHMTPDQVACATDIAGHLSAVFLGASELDGAAHTTPVGSSDVTQLDDTGVPIVLTTPPGSASSKLGNAQIKLDRDLLAAYLNLADGAYSWDTPVDGTTTFGGFITEVERIRLTSTDWKEVQRTRQRLHHILH